MTFYMPDNTLVFVLTVPFVSLLSVFLPKFPNFIETVNDVNINTDATF